MTHQDEVHLRKNVAVVKGILTSAVGKNVQCYQRHGNAVREAAWLASVGMIAFGWLRQGKIDDCVKRAGVIVGFVFRTSTTITRQGLLAALRTCGGDLERLIVDAFAERLQVFCGRWTWHGKVNIAVDGTKFAAPRTQANQARLSPALSPHRTKRYQKPADQEKGSTAQILATVFYHLTTGLPLSWSFSASNGSERNSVVNALERLPKNTRLLGDAEYVGYPFWSAIIESGRSFLVRVGSNVTLITQLRRSRQSDGRVDYWPECAMNAGLPPIPLRLFHIKNGQRTVYLVTNELQMSAETAKSLYWSRWGIELFFRTVKQTFEAHQLRCRTPENAFVELTWTLLGIWHALYEAKCQLRDHGHPIDRLSPSKVLEAIQEVAEVIHVYAKRVPLLVERLSKALRADESGRTALKSLRRPPRKKKHRVCGPPNIRYATHHQKSLAAKLRN